MKRIFFLLAIISISATSCSKKCWTCTVDTDGIVSQEQICEKDEQEIKELEATPLETKDGTGRVVYITTFSNCTPE